VSKFAVAFFTVALMAGFAETYKVTLATEMSNGGKTLKAGNYKVEVVGQNAVFKMGKETVEVPVTVSESATKYRDTQVSTSGSELTEIDVAGTKTKLLFKVPEASKTAVTGGGF
jgi:hypothetical protein